MLFKGPWESGERGRHLEVGRRSAWEVTGVGSFKLMICEAGFVLLSKTHSHQVLPCFVSELLWCGCSWTFPRALSAVLELMKLADEMELFPGNLLFLEIWEASLEKHSRKRKILSARPLHHLVLNSFTLPAECSSWENFPLPPFCDNLMGPYSRHRRDMRCLRSHCGEAEEGMGFEYCEDGEENLTSGFFSHPICALPGFVYYCIFFCLSFYTQRAFVSVLCGECSMWCTDGAPRNPVIC